MVQFLRCFNVKFHATEWIEQLVQSVRPSKKSTFSQVLCTNKYIKIHFVDFSMVLKHYHYNP